MLIINEQTINVLKEFGRKTNPKSSEKIRALKCLAIDCKYKRFTKKLKVDDMMYVLSSTPLASVPNIYANLSSLAGKKENEFYDTLKDEIIFVGINTIVKEENGKEKKMFSFSLSSSETKTFVENLDACITYASENLSKKEKCAGGDIFETVIEKTKNSNGDKKLETLNLQAKSIYNIFNDQKYLVVRRELVIKEKESGKESNMNIWFVCGSESNTYAIEAKKVVEEFGVIPLTSASSVTEIIPR